MQQYHDSHLPSATATDKAIAQHNLNHTISQLQKKEKKTLKYSKLIIEAIVTAPVNAKIEAIVPVEAIL